MALVKIATFVSIGQSTTKTTWKICLVLKFIYSCEDPGPADQDYPILRKLEEKWMINMGSLAALDPQQGCNKRDDAKAKAWRTGGS